MCNAACQALPTYLSIGWLHCRWSRRIDSWRYGSYLNFAAIAYCINTWILLSTDTMQGVAWILSRANGWEAREVILRLAALHLFISRLHRGDLAFLWTRKATMTPRGNTDYTRGENQKKKSSAHRVPHIPGIHRDRIFQPRATSAHFT